MCGPRRPYQQREPRASVTHSCPSGRKYENNPWQDRIVDRLRQYDTRFGYNAKPTRTAADNNGFPVIAAGDEFTFFAGAGIGAGFAATSTRSTSSSITAAVAGRHRTFRNISPEPSDSGRAPAALPRLMDSQLAAEGSGAHSARRSTDGIEV